MPINYKDYPSNWKTEIRPAILNRDNHRCKFCGVHNYEIGYWVNDVFVNPVYLRYGHRNLSYKAAKEEMFNIQQQYDFNLIILC